MRRRSSPRTAARHRRRRRGTLGALIRDGGRGAPVTPAHFEEELKEKVFTKDSDVKICAGLYRASPACSRPKTLSFTTLAWTAADWRHMGGALACCPAPRALSLGAMRVDDATMAARGAPDSGAPPAPRRSPRQQDRRRGLRHLGGALARGAAPAPRRWPRANKIGDEGVRHLGTPRARRGARAQGARSTTTRSATRVCATCDDPRAARRPPSTASTRPRQRARQSAVSRAATACSTAPSSSRTADAKELDCGEGAGLRFLWGDKEARRFAAALEHAHARARSTPSRRSTSAATRSATKGCVT